MREVEITKRMLEIAKAAANAVPKWECPVHGEIGAVTLLRIPGPAFQFGTARRYCSRCLGDAAKAAGIAALELPQADEGG